MSTGVIIRQKVTTLDKIRKYYLKGEDSVKLSDKQNEIRERIYKSWNLLINYHSREQAMKVLTNEYGCSRAQSYRYVNDALSVFGNPIANQKEAKRYLIEEDLMRLQQRAIKDKDGYLELAVIKQRIKLGGFDKDTDPKFNPEKLQAQTYILKPHPAVLKMIEKFTDSGVLDFNNMDVEDVEFADVNTGDDADDYEPADDLESNPDE